MKLLFKINKWSFWMPCLLFYSVNSLAQTPQPTPSPYNAGSSINFVRTWHLTAPEQDSNLVVTRPLKDVKQTTTYFDGLGRQIQVVVKQGSLSTGSSPVDMVMPVVYDPFGREVYQYLPFAANNTGGNVLAP